MSHQNNGNGRRGPNYLRMRFPIWTILVLLGLVGFGTYFFARQAPAPQTPKTVLNAARTPTPTGPEASATPPPPAPIMGLPLVCQDAILPVEMARCLDQLTATSIVLATANAFATATSVSARETSESAITATQVAFGLAMAETLTAPTVEANRLDIQRAQDAATAAPQQTALAQATVAAGLTQTNLDLQTKEVWLAHLGDLLNTLVIAVVGILGLALIAAVAIGLIFLWQYLTEVTRQRHAQAVKTYPFIGPDGNVYDFDLIAGMYRMIVAANRTRPESRSTIDSIPSSTRGVVTSFLAPPRQGTKPMTVSQNAALRLLRAALQHQRENPDWPQGVIPGHARLRWSGSAWDLAVRSLGSHLRKEGEAENARYLLTDHSTLLELYEVINREYQPE